MQGTLCCTGAGGAVGCAGGGLISGVEGGGDAGHLDVSPLTSLYGTSAASPPLCGFPMVPLRDGGGLIFFGFGGRDTTKKRGGETKKEEDGMADDGPCRRSPGSEDDTLRDAEGGDEQFDACTGSGGGPKHQVREEQRTEVRDIGLYTSDIAIFLRTVKPEKEQTNQRLSHTLMTGGAYFISPKRIQQGRTSDDLTTFYTKLGMALSDGTMPPISETHTVKFPMYLDVDMETPMQHIPKEAVRRMASKMNSQMQKFFPRLSDIKMIVCTKTKGGTYEEKKGLYKQGIHVHWPDIIVVAENACTIRNGIIQGMGAEDWSADLGLNDPDWEKIIDRAVYRTSGPERGGGLRMVGAPKAKFCGECPKCEEDKYIYEEDEKGNKKKVRNPKYEPYPPCYKCYRKNSCHVIDDNVYMPTDLFFGTSPDDAGCRTLRSNNVCMLMQTTVRAGDATLETPGFYVYEPQLALDKERTTARKVDNRSMRDYVLVDSPEIARIMRMYLVMHSEKYAESSMKIWFNKEKPHYKVHLTGGDGAHFCMNKGCCHRSSKVWMEIAKCKSSSHFVSRMRCFSKKPIVYKHGPCFCYTSSRQQTVLRPYIDTLGLLPGTREWRKESLQSQCRNTEKLYMEAKQNKEKRLKTT